MDENELIKQISALTNRIEFLENKLDKISFANGGITTKGNNGGKAITGNEEYYTTDVLQKYFKGSPFVHSSDLPPNVFTFAGNYTSPDGSIGSRFGAWISNLNCVMSEENTFEISKIIDAYANEDRIKIIKCLLQKNMSAKELQDVLKFNTTGKLYHHLSTLENIGIIYKQNEVFHMTGYAIGCSLMFLDTASRLIRRYEQNNNKKFD